MGCTGYPCIKGSYFRRTVSSTIEYHRPNNLACWRCVFVGHTAFFLSRLKFNPELHMKVTKLLFCLALLALPVGCSPSGDVVNANQVDTAEAESAAEETADIMKNR